MLSCGLWFLRPGLPSPQPFLARRRLTVPPHADSSNVDHLVTSSALEADPYVERLGRFRIDFEALRKRKEALGGNDRPCRLLKRMKYFAMDE